MYYNVLCQQPQSSQCQLTQLMIQWQFLEEKMTKLMSGEYKMERHWWNALVNSYKFPRIQVTCVESGHDYLQGVATRKRLQKKN